MAKVKLTELGMQGTAGLRADITIAGFTFTGSTDAWPHSENYKKFQRVVEVLRGVNLSNENPSGKA